MTKQQAFYFWNCCRICRPDTPLEEMRKPTKFEKRVLAKENNCEPKDIVSVTYCPKCNREYILGYFND